MDEIKELLQTQLAGTIDFKGQELYEFISSAVIYGGVALTVVAACALGDFDYIYKGLIATYTASLIVALPIPAYRRNPVAWKTPSTTKVEGVEVVL